MDRLVFSLSRGSRAGFALNHHMVFHELQDNREITVTFCAKSARLAELNYSLLYLRYTKGLRRISVYVIGRVYVIYIYI